MYSWEYKRVTDVKLNSTVIFLDRTLLSQGLLVLDDESKFLFPLFKFVPESYSVQSHVLTGTHANQPFRLKCNSIL